MTQPGVLLVNLGSPDSPNAGDVRRYLREFLMDERVLDAPYLFRLGIVHLAILPSRPKQSAEAYRKIWTTEGSPLVVTSLKVCAALRARTGLPVELGMRYQNPSITRAIEKLRRQGVTDLFLIPMFPHYAMSSYETAVERVRSVLAQSAPEMSLSVMAPYYDQPDYIAALVGTASEYLTSKYDHFLFSFHGLPERHLRKADPTSSHCLINNNCCTGANAIHKTCYRAQCFKTVQAFAELADLPKDKFSVAFQSRLGREPWLKPYTDQVIARLAATGTRKLLVICPAFVTDCLETLEEIGIRGQETFRQAGGEELTLIPCLNDHPLWIAALEKMINSWISSDLSTRPKKTNFNEIFHPPQLAATGIGIRKNTHTGKIE
jgi:ferrochelatase